MASQHSPSSFDDSGIRTSSTSTRPDSLADPSFVNCDVLLWCAKAEEKTLLLKSLSQGERSLLLFQDRRRVDGADNTVTPGVLHSKSGEFSVILVCGFHQGVESCGIALTSVLHLYRPKYAMMIGICAAYGEGAKLGSVVMADAGLNYESGKCKEANGEYVFLGDTRPVGSSDHQLRNLMVEYRAEGDLQESLSEPGTMLSGSAVREDLKRIYCEMKPKHRGIAGLDMETSAFFSACRVCRVVALGVFKGISDNGDEHKDDHLHGKSIEAARKRGVGFIDYYFTRRNISPTGTVISADLHPEVGLLLDRYETAQKDRDAAKERFSRSKQAVLARMDVGLGYKASNGLYYQKKIEKKPNLSVSLSNIGDIDGINLSKAQLAAIQKEKQRLKDEAEEREEISSRRTNPNGKTASKRSAACDADDHRDSQKKRM